MRSITKRRWRAPSAQSRLILTAPLLGIAYALGPNYNKPWEAFEPGEAQSAAARAHAAVAQAQRCAGLATGPEQALIAAVGYRYPDDRPSGDNASWNRDYAGAMRAAYREALGRRHGQASRRSGHQTGATRT